MLNRSESSALALIYRPIYIGPVNEFDTTSEISNPS